MSILSPQSLVDVVLDVPSERWDTAIDDMAILQRREVFAARQTSPFERDRLTEQARELSPMGTSLRRGIDAATNGAFAQQMPQIAAGSVVPDDPRLAMARQMANSFIEAGRQRKMLDYQRLATSPADQARMRAEAEIDSAQEFNDAAQTEQNKSALTRARELSSTDTILGASSFAGLMATQRIGSADEFRDMDSRLGKTLAPIFGEAGRDRVMKAVQHARSQGYNEGAAIAHVLKSVRDIAIESKDQETVNAINREYGPMLGADQVPPAKAVTMIARAQAAAGGGWKSISRGAVDDEATAGRLQDVLSLTATWDDPAMWMSQIRLTPSMQPGTAAGAMSPGEVAANKARIQNSDGSFSTERTITIESDGKHYVIPTIVDGKVRSPEEATKLWADGKNKAVGVFDNDADAERFATQRSRDIGDAARGTYAGVDGGNATDEQVFDYLMTGLGEVASNEDMPPAVRAMAQAKAELGLAWAVENRPGAARRFLAHNAAGLSNAILKILATPATIGKYGSAIAQSLLKKALGEDSTLAHAAGFSYRVGEAVDNWIDAKTDSGRAYYSGFDPSTVRQGAFDASNLGQIAGEIESIIATLPFGGAAAGEALAAKTTNLAGRAALRGIGAGLPHLRRFTEQNFDSIKSELVANGLDDVSAAGHAAFWAPFAGTTDVVLGGLQFGLHEIPAATGIKNVVMRGLAHASLSGGTGAASGFLSSVIRSVVAESANKTAGTGEGFIHRLFSEDALKEHAEVAVVSGAIGAIFGLATMGGQRHQGEVVPVATRVKAIESMVGRPLNEKEKADVARFLTGEKKAATVGGPERVKETLNPVADTNEATPSPYAIPEPKSRLVFGEEGDAPPVGEVAAWVKENPTSAAKISRLQSIDDERLVEFSRGAASEGAPEILHDRIKKSFRQWADENAAAAADSPEAAIGASVIEHLNETVSNPDATDPERSGVKLSDERRASLDRRRVRLEKVAAQTPLHEAAAETIAPSIAPKTKRTRAGEYQSKAARAANKARADSGARLEIARATKAEPKPTDGPAATTESAAPPESAEARIADLKSEAAAAGIQDPTDPLRVVSPEETDAAGDEGMNVVASPDPNTTAGDETIPPETKKVGPKSINDVAPVSLDPVVEVSDRLRVLLGLPKESQDEIAKGLRPIPKRTESATGQMLKELGFDQVLVYSGPGADSINALAVSSPGMKGRTLIVRKAESTATKIRKWAMHETMHEVIGALPRKTVDSMIEFLDLALPGTRAAVEDRYYALAKERMGDEWANEYRDSGALARETLAVLAHDLDVVELSDAEYTADPEIKNAASVIERGLGKGVFEKIAKAFGSSPEEVASIQDSFAAVMKNLDPTATKKRLANGYGIKVSDFNLKSVLGVLSLATHLWKRNYDRLVETSPRAPSTSKEVAIDAPTAMEMIAGHQGEDSPAHRAAQEYFADNPFRMPLSTLIEDTALGDENALAAIDILRQTKDADPSSAVRFAGYINDKLNKMGDQEISPRALALFRDFDVLRIAEGEDAPFAIGGLDEGKMRRVLWRMLGRNRLANTVVNKAERAKLPKDISELDRLLVNQLIVAMTAEPDLRKLVTEIALNNLAEHNELSDRLSELSGIIRKVPKKLRPTLADMMDERLNPNKRASSQRWKDIEATHGPVFADALEALKRFDEQMRIEIIAIKREGVRAAVSEMSTKGLVEWAQRNGSPELVHISVNKSPVVFDTLSSTVINPAQVVERVVNGAVPDNWGKQWAHFHHAFEGDISITHLGEQGATAKTVDDARRAIARHAGDLQERTGIPPTPDDYDITFKPDDQTSMLIGLTPGQKKSLNDITGSRFEGLKKEIKKAVGHKGTPDMAGSSFYAASMPRLKDEEGWSRDLEGIMRLATGQHVRNKYWHKMRREVTGVANQMHDSGRPNSALLLAHMVEMATKGVTPSDFEKGMNWTVNKVANGVARALMPLSLPLRKLGVATPEWATVKNDVYLYRRMMANVRAFNGMRLISRPAQALVNSTQPYIYGSLFLKPMEIASGLAFYGSGAGKRFIEQYGIRQPQTAFTLGPLKHLSTVREFLHKNLPVSPIREWANHDAILAVGYDAGINRGLTHEEALSRAYHGMLMTQFTHLPSLTPKAFAGPTRSTMLQFKSFLINTWALMWKMGNPFGEAPVNPYTNAKMTPGERIAGLAKMQMGVALIGGMSATLVGGIVSIGNTIWSALNYGNEEAELTGSIEDHAAKMFDRVLDMASSHKISDEMKKKVTTLFSRGVPSWWGGDMSGQVDLFVPVTGKTAIDKLVNFVSGPTASLISTYIGDMARAHSAGKEMTPLTPVKQLGDTILRTSAALRAYGDIVDVFGDVVAGRAPSITRTNSLGQTKTTIEGFDTIWAMLGSRTKSEREYSETVSAVLAAGETSKWIVARAATQAFEESDFPGARKTIATWNDGLPGFAWIEWKQVESAIRERIAREQAGNTVLDATIQSAGRAAYGKVKAEGKGATREQAPKAFNKYGP